MFKQKITLNFAENSAFMLSKDCNGLYFVDMPYGVECEVTLYLLIEAFNDDGKLIYSKKILEYNDPYINEFEYHCIDIYSGIYLTDNKGVGSVEFTYDSVSGEKEYLYRGIDGDHDYKITATKEPEGCTGWGYTEYTCTKCGKTYTSDHREALGHAFGEWTVKTEATCEKAGTQESVCARCGRKEKG